MGRFTDLGTKQLAELAEEFSLGALQSFKPIDAGTINSNYLLETASGRFFLRVNEGKEESEVAYEVAVLAHLVAGGVPTPLPVMAKDGQRYAGYAGQFISVFPWRDGHHVDSQTISEADCASLGKALGRLQVAGRGMKPALEGRYTFASIRVAYQRFMDSRDPELAEALAVLAKEFAWLDEQAADRSAQERGLVHTDLFPDNVLMAEGEVVALLDFEQACFASYLYDLAVSINAWCFGDALEPGRLRALLAGYEESRALAPADLGSLWIELRASALRFVVTRIRDIHLAGGSGGDKDFRRFLMRLRTWQDLGSDAFADLAKPTVPA